VLRARNPAFTSEYSYRLVTSVTYDTFGVRRPHDRPARQRRTAATDRRPRRRGRSARRLASGSTAPPHAREDRLRLGRADADRAGCSLAVAVGGGLVDRKRPFTLLRVSGTQVGVLSRVVLLEAGVPLIAATVLAAGIAYGTSLWAFVRLAPKGTAIPQLGHDYYTIMGIGLVVAFSVITVTLPLLRRMTAPGNVRFE
jgi:hypothetical protein